MSDQKRPSSADFAQHVKGTRTKLHAAIDKLAAGNISHDAWHEEFYDALVHGHSQAWTMGRQRAGDLSATSRDDLLMGREMADRESDWLHTFLVDLESGRYTDEHGTLQVAAVKTRADLYAQKLRGTANEAFVETGEDDDEIYWILGGGQHCPDCPRWAEMSPFTKDTMPAYPCSGDCQCLGNCHCHLERHRGNDILTGFKPVKLDPDDGDDET